MKLSEIVCFDRDNLCPNMYVLLDVDRAVHNMVLDQRVVSMVKHIYLYLNCGKPSSWPLPLVCISPTRMYAIYNVREVWNGVYDKVVITKSSEACNRHKVITKNDINRKY